MNIFDYPVEEGLENEMTEPSSELPEYPIKFGNPEEVYRIGLNGKTIEFFRPGTRVSVHGGREGEREYLFDAVVTKNKGGIVTFEMVEEE